MRPAISDILKMADEQKKKQDKIAVLKHFDNPVLRLVLEHAYNPSIKFLLPKTDPPYKPFIDEAKGMLYTEARKLYLFTENGNKNLTSMKREILFIRMLESIDPEDAKLLLHVKNKKLPYKSITPKLVKEALGILQ